MKNTFIKLSLIFSVFALIVSCDDDNNYAGESTQQATAGNATITLAFDATQSFVEKNEVYTYTVTLSEPQIADVKIPITLVGGTATEHLDFDFDHEVKISRNTMSAEGTISVYADTDPEDTENFTLQIGNSEGIANASVSPQTVNFTLDNFISDDLDMSFNWERDIDYLGDAYSACVNIDLDIFVSDAAGFDIADPWATWNGTAYAASGDCPEEFTMVMADWGDGEYIIWHENWANGFAGLDTNTLVPITATLVRAGAFTEVVVQDDSQALNADNGGEADDVPFETHGFIVKVTIAGGLYTITDYAGTVLVDGKSAKAKTERPNITRVREREPSSTLQ